MTQAELMNTSIYSEGSDTTKIYLILREIDDFNTQFCMLKEFDLWDLMDYFESKGLASITRFYRSPYSPSSQYGLWLIHMIASSAHYDRRIRPTNDVFDIPAWDGSVLCDLFKIEDVEPVPDESCHVEAVAVEAWDVEAVIPIFKRPPERPANPQVEPKRWFRIFC